MSGDQEKNEEKGPTSGSGFIGAVAGSGRPQPEEGFEEIVQKAHDSDPEAFLRGAASTHTPSSSDKDTPPLPSSDAESGTKKD